MQTYIIKDMAKVRKETEAEAQFFKILIFLLFGPFIFIRYMAMLAFRTYNNLKRRRRRRKKISTCGWKIPKVQLLGGADLGVEWNLRTKQKDLDKSIVHVAKMSLHGEKLYLT